MEPFAVALAEDYRRQTDRLSYVEANRRLARFQQRLVIGDLNLSEPSSFPAFAEARATECQRAGPRPGPSKARLGACLRVAARYGIDAPASTRHTLDQAVERMQQPKWWLRRVHILAARAVEQVHRDLATVCKLRGIYASDHSVKRYERVLARRRVFLESHMMVSDDGQSVPLADIHDRTVSNPKIRRGELMARIRGFEDVATQLGHGSLFITLTTPSRMHACGTKGVPNPRYDGSSARDAQAYLCRVGARIRAQMGRHGLRPYGFRVAEPHHDGTPHWHFLLHAPVEQLDAIANTFRRYGLEEDGNEPGAARHRVKIVYIDPSKGTASGYVAKYVAKGIDGAHIESDSYGNDAATSAFRIRAWASTWGIRQFQQIGGPPVTVWRELRRLRDESDSALEPARAACDAGEWAAFCIAMGGVDLPRSAFAIALVRLPDESNADQPVQIFLLARTTGELITTRTQRWHIEAGADGLAGPSPPPPLDLCQ